MENDERTVCLGNYSELAKARCLIFEKEIPHLSEIAELLGNEAGEDEIFFRDSAFIEKYRSITGDMARSAKTLLGVPAQSKIAPVVSMLGAFERATVCRELTDILGIRGVRAAEMFFDSEELKSNATVAYLRSASSDKAFIKLSEMFSEVKVSCCKDFSEVCESTYYGKSDYCILPMKNSSDGRLAGILKAVEKYSLKICAACEIEGEKGKTEFALLGKSIISPKTESGVRFRFRVKTDLSSSEPSEKQSKGGIAPIVVAASTCRLQILDVVSSPSDPLCYDVTVSAGFEGICGFLCFLCLEYQNYHPIGIYEVKFE